MREKEYQYLTIQKHLDHAIIHVSLNRPEKRNALNVQMWREIGHFFTNLVNPEYRCVLLTGNGKGFCAGIDVMDPKFQSTFSNDVDNDNKNDVARKFMSAKGMIRDMQDAFSALEDKCPIPVVVAIHGSCIGAGIDLACAADIRLCDENAFFSIMEVKIGLAADVGTLQRFPKIVGNTSVARELCLTGRTFTANEALSIGFVSRICSSTGNSLMDQAFSICKQIASNSPVAVAGTKKSLVFSRDHSVSEGLEHIAIHNSAALMTNDLMTAMQHNLYRKHELSTSPRFDNLLPQSKL